MVEHVPAAASPKAAQYREISTNKASILLRVPIQGTSERTAGKAMQGKGTDTRSGTSVY